MAVAVEEAVRVHEMLGDERSEAMKNLVRYLEQVAFFEVKLWQQFSMIITFCFT